MNSEVITNSSRRPTSIIVDREDLAPEEIAVPDLHTREGGGAEGQVEHVLGQPATTGEHSIIRGETESLKAGEVPATPEYTPRMLKRVGDTIRQRGKTRRLGRLGLAGVRSPRTGR